MLTILSSSDRASALCESTAPAMARSVAVNEALVWAASGLTTASSAAIAHEYGSRGKLMGMHGNVLRIFRRCAPVVVVLWQAVACERQGSANGVPEGARASAGDSMGVAPTEPRT